MSRNHHHILSTTTLLLTGVLLALGFGPAAQLASAQCADPRGNAFCSNGGLVQGQNPSPGGVVRGQNPSPGGVVQGQNPSPGGVVQGQNPSPGGVVQGQNPSPGGVVQGQNPSPGGVVQGQNPSPGGVVQGQNPSPGGVVQGQNPDLPITTPVSGQLSALNGGGAPGDMVVVTGQGFGSNNNMYIDVIDSNGIEWDTDSRAFSCNETDNVALFNYQNYGLGCSSGVRPGPLDKSASDGTFSGVVMIPTTSSAGPAQLCAKGVFATICTPITISS
jgi:hypothetical protein